MDAVRILRQIFKLRLLVAAGFLVATVVGTLISYQVGLGIPPTFKSRHYEVGVASVDILVDSGNSQVADLGGGRLRTDLASLGTRAQLLANLLTASLLKEQIAVRAGIDPRQFHARVLAASTDAVAPDASALDAPPSPRANALTVSVRDLVPIITIDAQAADAATAGRIARAATAELDSYQSAAIIKVPQGRRLILKTLGKPRVGTAVRGPRRINGVIAFVLILGTWCAVLVIKEPLARRWREAAHDEDETGDAPGAYPSSSPPPAPEKRRPAAARTSPRRAPAGLSAPEAVTPRTNPVADVQLLRAPERPVHNARAAARRQSR